MTSSSKKRSKRVDENTVEGVSPVKRSSPMKSGAPGFSGKSPSKKQMMLLKHSGDEPDCDDEISPFKDMGKCEKRSSLLESLEQISFTEDTDNLLRTESV